MRSRGCVLLPLALLVVHSKKAGRILGTAVCQGMSLAWHWAFSGFADEAPGIQTHFASSSADLISKGAGISQKH